MCSVTDSHAQHPGFDSRHLHNRWDWWHSPVTLLLGTSIWDGAGNLTQVSITWLSLKWLVVALVLEVEWSRVWDIPLVLTTWNCGIVQGSGGLRPRILLTTLLIDRLPKQKPPFQCSPGRFEGSQSDWFLLATNGDIQAINAGSPNVHINLHTVQKVDGGKGKWLKETMPNKYHYIN